MAIRSTRGRVEPVSRGRTARNRLRRSDTWVARDDALRASSAPLYVDVGCSAEPSTTVETYRRLSRVAPGLRVVGVEMDPDRARAAQALAISGRLEFRFGSFDLPIARDERANVVRAMNVLRQFDARDHNSATVRLGRCLRDGGLLLEGTCSPTGRLLAANVYRRRGTRLARRGLLLAPDLARAWEPRELQTVLPENLIDRCEIGSWLDDFFGRWEKSYATSLERGLAARAAFVAAAHELDDVVDRDPSTIRRGFLLVRLPEPFEDASTG